ncbi:MAG: 2-deoxy-D-gluconate 3-dehydrogenase, partial [bacterium]
MSLTGLKCLVTGGSRGIGKGIAQALIAQGAEVVISGSNPNS